MLTVSNLSFSQSSLDELVDRIVSEPKHQQMDLQAGAASYAPVVECDGQMVSRVLYSL